MITDGRGDTSEKGRHLRSGLRETENVVNEKKHVLPLFVTEVFGDSQTSQGNTGTGTWGLVHLSVNKGRLGSSSRTGLLVDLDDSSLNHFVVQIVSFTSTLTNTGENGISSVVHGNVVDKFHDNNCFSDTGSSEQTNFSSFGVRGQKVNNLDSSYKNILRTSLLGKSRSGSVKRRILLTLLVSEDGSFFVDGLSDDIDDTSESFGSNRNLDRSSSIGTLLSSYKTIRRLHGNRTDSVFSQVLGHFQDQTLASGSDFNLQGVQNLRELFIKLDVDNGSDDLCHPAGRSGSSSAAAVGSKRSNCSRNSSQGKST